jgi:protein involved in polysaccharide export with SLBB domain
MRTCQCLVVAIVIAGIGTGAELRSQDNPKKQDDKIQAGDRLFLRVLSTIPNQPIEGIYRVEPSGKLPLGFGYGRVEVVGSTPEEAESRIKKHLENLLAVPPTVLVTRYDPIVHGEPGLRTRIERLERELKELREVVDQLRKKAASMP